VYIAGRSVLRVNHDYFDAGVWNLLFLHEETHHFRYQAVRCLPFISAEAKTQSVS
jgi:hypothetical protein